MCVGEHLFILTSLSQELKVEETNVRDRDVRQHERGGTEDLSDGKDALEVEALDHCDVSDGGLAIYVGARCEVEIEMMVMMMRRGNEEGLGNRAKAAADNDDDKRTEVGKMPWWHVIKPLCCGVCDCECVCVDEW